MPSTTFVRRVGQAAREVHHGIGVTEEDMAEVVPPSWVP